MTSNRTSKAPGIIQLLFELLSKVHKPILKNSTQITTHILLQRFLQINVLDFKSISKITRIFYGQNLPVKLRFSFIIS